MRRPSSKVAHHHRIHSSRFEHLEPRSLMAANVTATLFAAPAQRLDELAAPTAIVAELDAPAGAGAATAATPKAGYVVQGAIRDKWLSLGGASGFLGAPLTNETTTPDRIGRYNHFQGGSIYWTPSTGAHEIHGAIRDKWAALGWERSVLGYPTTDECKTPDGVGRYNHFQGGSVYWTPATGAREVHGTIRAKWAELGWERSYLGYPKSDEYSVAGGRRSDFQGGYIFWNAANGQVSVYRNVPPVSKFMITDKFGGRVWDAEKSPGDDGVGEPTHKVGCDDDLLCWAAAASNVLTWSGWGNVGGMSNSDLVFRYFATHWTDNGGFSDAAWNWWFSGNNPTQNWNGVSHVDVAGGGFYRNLNVANYLRSSTDRAGAMNTISSYLQSGYGVNMWITGPGDHMITCWGYEFDPANPSSFRGVYVTDSDDAKGMTNPPDQLQYYAVKYSGGQWYLQNYYGSNSWSIKTVYGLARSPSGARGATSADASSGATGAVIAFSAPANRDDVLVAARAQELHPNLSLSASVSNAVVVLDRTVLATAAEQKVPLPETLAVAHPTHEALATSLRIKLVDAAFAEALWV